MPSTILLNKEYFKIDFSKEEGAFDPENKINLKIFQIALFFGWNVRVSKSSEIFSDDFNNGKEINYVGQISIHDTYNSLRVTYLTNMREKCIKILLIDFLV